MAESTCSRRKLVNITLEEAIEVLRLGEGNWSNVEYKLRTKTNTFGERFAQLYYVYSGEEQIAVNFSDDKNAVKLCRGNEYFRTHHRIIEYLKGRGFDLNFEDSEKNKDVPKSHEIVIRAGPGGEDSDVYRWIHSRKPEWAKSVDDPRYRILSQTALEAATKIVRETGKEITLKLLVDER